MSKKSTPTDSPAAAKSPGVISTTTGSTSAGTDLLRRSVRDMGVDDREVSSFFARLLGWFSDSSWEQEVRAREAYLAQAKDSADLEYRMRKLDSSLVYRAPALR